MTRRAFRIRLWVFAGVAALASVTPAEAHHRGVAHEGPAIGVAIPAISQARCKSSRNIARAFSISPWDNP